MALLDIISDFLGLNPESYQDRLLEEIQLFSPEGDEFNAAWIGNKRSVSKKIGAFTFPGISGTKVQDLDVEGTLYPLTIFFHGAQNDLIADSFFSACGQNGKWDVEHPVAGPLTLQILSYEQDMQPVTTGNITKFEIQTLEALPDAVFGAGGAAGSTSELGSSIDSQAVGANADASNQFQTNVLQDSFNQYNSLLGSVGQGISAIKTTLRAVETFELVPAQANAILAGISSTIASSPINTEQLAGQVQTLTKLYAEAQDSVSDSLQMFGEYIGVLDEIEPLEEDQEGKNTTATKELFMSAAIVGMGLTAKVGGQKTGAETIQNAETLEGSFTSITDSLDLIQDAYSTSPLTLQYFSQSESYSSALELVSTAATFLLLSSFDLAKEKRFTLDVPSSPIVVTVQEYGSLGDEDENLNLFCDANEITGSELFVMPAGTEVVVYV